MVAYLNLTREMAKAIVASGQREHWAEARLVMDGIIVAGQPDDPEFVLFTFVRKFGTSDKGADKLCANTGQVIVVLAPDHGKTPRIIYGQPLTEIDAMARDIQRNRLLASIGQPQAFKRRRA